MSRLAILFIGIICSFLFVSQLGHASEVPTDTICGVDRSQFPAVGREVQRETCIVDGDTAFDPWVNGIAFMWVNTTSERFFQVMTDYKNWKRRICNVERVSIITQQPDYRVVEWKILNDTGTTRYTNEYLLFPDTEPKRVTFKYIGPGQIDGMEGEWALFSNQPDTDQLLIRYTVKLNPSTIFTEEARRFVHRNLECLLSDLRTWAEQEPKQIVILGD